LIGLLLVASQRSRQFLRGFSGINEDNAQILAGPGCI
jgi:hypothetical protein